MANKWTFERPINMSNNTNLQKLVQFYIWETPVPGTSQKGVPFTGLNQFISTQGAANPAPRVSEISIVRMTQNELNVFCDPAVQTISCLFLC